MPAFTTILCACIGCLTMMLILFLVTASLPKSWLRDVVLGGLTAVGCAAYVVMPLDVIPEGILGPVGAVDDVALFGVAVEQVRKLLHRREHAEALS